jgi:hypothetical protein
VVSMLYSGTQDRGFKPGRSRRIFPAKKFSAWLPSEGKYLRHVKDPPKRRRKGVTSAKLPDTTVPPFALLGTWRHLAAKVETSKGRGKQWQTTPKNLPRMQRARAIQVA